MTIKTSILFFLSLFLICQAFTQDTSQIEKKEKRFTLAGYPVAFYSPETSWGVGGYLLTAFRFKNQTKETPPSQISVTAAYTGMNQLLTYIPFQFFLGEQDYILKGEVGYYRYFYRFFGVGNELPKTTDEIYSVNFPRVRLTGLKNIGNNVYLGGNYAFDGFDIVEKDPEGILVKDSLVGSNGGILSGIGPSFTFDSRDNVFYPSKGYFVNISGTFHDPVFGASFCYGKVEYDFATYVADKWKNVWAFNYYGGFNTGIAPLNDMIELGGSKKGRGTFRGKYRDRFLNLLQAEYRFKVWKRFSGAAFSSYGGVTDKLENYQLNNMRLNYGAGIRYAFDPVEKINIRLDVAFGDTEPGVYIILSEAF